MQSSLANACFIRQKCQKWQKWLNAGLAFSHFFFLYEANSKARFATFAQVHIIKRMYTFVYWEVYGSFCYARRNVQQQLISQIHIPEAASIT